ncbi:MAG: ComF family protein, partial [Alphaproteobacteria bacterium]|nr:ComF family protein [Alphaproteobacteria bacterium]
FRRARAAVVYDDIPRRMIIRFKHADRLDLRQALVAWLRRAGAELVPQADVIIPVPLHPRRLFQRKYNQSAVLAQQFSTLTGIPYEPLALVRRRATPAQGSFNRSQRWRNVRGAFVVPEEAAALVKDRTVLLIDDVFTTGATAHHASLALGRAEAAHVDVLSLARVVLPSDPAI